MADYYSILPIMLGLLALVLSVFFYKKTKDDHASEIMSIVRSIISYNSQELSQYHFLALKHHNHLKNELLEMRGDDVSEIKKELDGHVEYLTKTLHKVASYNFKYLERYFSDRSKVAPIITLRLFKEGRYLNTIASNSAFQNISLGYQIDKNTAFAHIVHTGTYFLCNDIDKATSRRTYLSEEQLTYRSSVAVPLVLVNNALDESFSQMLNIEEIEKTIFGVLTVDHPTKNYFNEEDIGVLSIVSELLTNFLVVYNMFTEFSQTYHKSVKLAGDDSANKGCTLARLNPSLKYHPWRQKNGLDN
jgi:hypothetical protein